MQDFPQESALSHLNAAGEAQMVDVSGKAQTHRSAIAQAVVTMAPSTWEAIATGNAPKGDVLATARIAGIMAAKQTANLIPLCHPLPLQKVTVDIVPLPSKNGYTITTEVKTTHQTGVEMEALTAASVAALTLYDMAKALDKAIAIESVYLLEKLGGKSGPWQRPPATSG